MAEKKNQRKVFNFDDSPLVKTTEQTVVEGYQRLESEGLNGQANGQEKSAEQGGGETATAVAEIPQHTEREQQQTAAPSASPAVQGRPQTIPAAVAVANGEPTQNINVPIPVSLHQRLKIISAQTRQNMKDLVALAIKEYVKRQG